MNCGMIRWKVELQYPDEFEGDDDDDDAVFVVRKWTKFSTVRGTMSGRKVRRSVPRREPPWDMVM